MKTKCATLAATALIVAAPVGAANLPMELELPTLDGARFFGLVQARGRPVVLNFWSDDCPPCVREMPLLERQSRARKEVLFVGIAVTEPRRARNFLDSRAVSYLQLKGPPDPAALLRRFSDRPGALPHTAVLRRDHTLCEVHTGEVDAQWLDAVLSRCAGP